MVSLRWRLAAAIALILVLAGGITFEAIYRGTGAQLRGQIDRELRADVTAFAGQGVPGRPSGPRSVEAAGHRYVAAQPFHASARLLVERVVGGGLVTNQPELLGLGRERDEPAAIQAEENRQAMELRDARPGFSTVEVADAGDVRLLTRTVRRAGRPVAMVGVAEPLEPAERAQHSVGHTFAIAGSLTLLAALVAGYLVAARMSRPLRKMSAIAARVDGGDLSPRIEAGGPGDEIRILADTFDHMLDRLEDAFARQHDFVSDASHELRTPLTVIRGQLEVLARRAEPSPEDVRRVEHLVRTELDRMQRLVDDLLLLAASAERDFVHPSPIRMPGFLEELVEGMRTAVDDRELTLADMHDGTLSADPDRVAQALRNLLVNAIEHTAPGDRIEVTAAVRDGALDVSVDDSGPGIPPEQRPFVFDRFHRTDAARSRSAGGAGLGLAIVQAIARAHGGDVAVGDSPLGGARVTVSLPGFARGVQAHRGPRARA